MTTSEDVLDEITRLLAPAAKEVNITNNDVLDRAAVAFREESDRWCWRRNIIDGNHFEIVRNSSPNNDISDDQYFQIIRLTKRECRDRHEAEIFLRTYRDRAAMLAALKAL
jgi:acetone carboxylase gamma subunit